MLLGAHYEWRAAGPLHLIGELARVQSDSRVLNPFKNGAARDLGTQSRPLWAADFDLGLSLTGGKSWHRLVPEVAGGFGLISQFNTPPDTGGFKFGTRFSLNVGAGPALCARRQVSDSLRCERSGLHDLVSADVLHRANRWNGGRDDASRKILLAEQPGVHAGPVVPVLIRAPSRVPTFLTRRVTFAAAHRYRRPEWSEEENARVFGLCARENYHGHSYVCEVTVTGDVDPRTGMLVDLAVLDRVLDAEVRSRFDHRNVNLDVPEFADGKRIPTGEELRGSFTTACNRRSGRCAW